MSAPRTFFLNELHEYARGERSGGGGNPKFGPIDWAARGEALARNLTRVKAEILASHDPVRASHLFMKVNPTPVPKISTTKGAFDAPTKFAGEQSLVFRRLGVDLIEVLGDGAAVVHATPAAMERMLLTAASLERQGAREQARWVTLAGVDLVPPSARLDSGWVDVGEDCMLDAIVHLQPLLGAVDSETVIHALAPYVYAGREQGITAVGADYSGRRWLRCTARPWTLKAIASTFLSVQSIHPPEVFIAAGGGRRKGNVTPREQSISSAPIGELPIVAVVDTGVSPPKSCEWEEHTLERYRAGTYTAPGAERIFRHLQETFLERLRDKEDASSTHDHGSFVASRIVFGERTYPVDERNPPGDVAFFDVVVGDGQGGILTDRILEALQQVIANRPEVRVFNLSIGGSKALELAAPIEKKESLIRVRDLDNLIAVHDIIVVIAAANSQKGVAPAKPYPNHVDEPSWGLPALPSGHNTLTCGASVTDATAGGLATENGAPSPFTRIGPKLAGAQIEFGAHGGNVNDDWRFRPGLGVWGWTEDTVWEDRNGTSYAAPLLARTVARLLQDLAKYCPEGVRPFGVTAKAFLMLTAERPSFSTTALTKLADRTIGYGSADGRRLTAPSATSAVLLWQGEIAGPKDIVRVLMPVPPEWLKQAASPKLRVVCCWDPPVSNAASSFWSVRDAQRWAAEH